MFRTAIRRDNMYLCISVVQKVRSENVVVLSNIHYNDHRGNAFVGTYSWHSVTDGVVCDQLTLSCFM